MNTGFAFISHASGDVAVANQLVESLESRGIRCWIAPRDILVGSDYAAAIINGLRNATALVLVLTPAANASPQVHREVERAAGYQVPILPVVIGEFDLNPSMEYFVSNTQQIRGNGGDVSGVASQLLSALSPIGTKAAPPTAVQAVPGTEPSAMQGYIEEGPPEISDLVDRDFDVASIVRGFETAAVSIVVGIAGMGKTQVASMVQRRLKDQGFDVFWRRVTPVDDLATLTSDMAFFLRGLGANEPSDLLLRSASEPAVAAAVSHALRQTRCLVVLDNLEAGTSEDVNRFLRDQMDAKGAARLLLTTREVPAWITEREVVHGLAAVHELGGFSLEESVDFLRRAHLRFSPQSDALIYARTKGHPLLLDLLCSQILSYGLDEDDLTDSLPDLSWDLDQFLLTNIYRGLSDTERNILGYLSVSLMPLSAKDLEMVLDGVESRSSVMEGLHFLERRRLVQRSKMAYLIHAVVRDFIYSQSRNVSEMHSRMADLLRSRDAQNGRLVQESCRHLDLAGRESEADNDVVDKFSLLWTGGYRAWTQEAVEAVIAHAERRQDWPVALKARLLLGRLQLEACDWNGVENTYAAGLELADSLNDDLARAWIDNNGAEVTVRRGHLDVALEAYEPAAVSLLGSGRELDAALARLNAGAALARFRHLKPAEERRLDCLQAFLGMGRWDLVAKAHSLGGLLSLEAGDLASAISMCDEDERLCHEVGDPNGVARVLNNRAIVLVRLGRLPEAEESIRRSLEVNAEQADEHAVAQGNGNLAAILSAQGNTAAATSALALAYLTFERIGDQVSLQELAYVDALLPEDVRLAKLDEWRSTPLAAYRAAPLSPDQPRFLWNVSYGYLP
jgi:tetratricopeptide (TPR) repeat protein